MECGRIAFQRTIDGQTAHMPAGATLDWTLDLSAVMAKENDQIASATWELGVGLTSGAPVNTPTSTTLFITAPATPSATAILCTITYTTTGGRTVPKQFEMHVDSPLSFY